MSAMAMMLYDRVLEYALAEGDVGISQVAKRCSTCARRAKAALDVATVDGHLERYGATNERGRPEWRYRVPGGSDGE